MKEVYTPKKNKFATPHISTGDDYESPADREIVQKRKNQLTALITEINRRKSENYHLD